MAVNIFNMPVKKVQNNTIIIKGARVNNLKNIDVDIPKNKLVVITGISGSGKSSLAFDTLYAEGQRRYIESLSSYARQFLDQLEKPDVNSITGLSPAIAIDQKTVSQNPRSTVGTITEIYDLLRLLFARAGSPHCPKCKTKIVKTNRDEILSGIAKKYTGKSIEIFSPIVKNTSGNFLKVIKEISKSNFSQVRIDTKIYPIQEALDLNLSETVKHNIDILIKTLNVPTTTLINKYLKAEAFKLSGAHGKAKDTLPDEETDVEIFVKAIDLALDLSNGQVIIVAEKSEQLFSRNFSCPKCNLDLDEIEPRLFSFNSPIGACPKCSGLGYNSEIDPDLVIPNKKLTLAQGAIRPWTKIGARSNHLILEKINKLAEKQKFSINTPIKDLNKKQLDLVLYGQDEFTGVIGDLRQKYLDTNSEFIKKEIEKYMRTFECDECFGKRLNSKTLSVKFANFDISQISELPISAAENLFTKLKDNKYKIKLSDSEFLIAEKILAEIYLRIKLLSEVGVSYLSLSRAANTLSGGEAQRIRLSTQLSAGLSGVLYVLDEPSIGLHHRDNKKLIDALINLRNLGNSVIVVEHDEQMMEHADHIIDIGPGAGKYGGEILATGTLAQIKKSDKSITGQYLSGKQKINFAKRKRSASNKKLVIKKASEFNLKNIDVTFPLGKMISITGVSGSGKSTLVNKILAKALAKKFHGAKDMPGKHKEILGLQNIDKVISIDQSPIGRTPRSNPATYTGVFTYIRDLFAQTKEARIKNLEAGHFSFNVKGGRCENCAGDGSIKIEMNFLSDIYVPCPECHGKRFKSEILDIYYKNKNIANVLEMTVSEAKEFFSDQAYILSKLQILDDVGLGYIELGQPAPTLSGGEAQRVKLATELSRRATGKTLYILDEPTTGLHFADIEKLLLVLNELVDKGNTVCIIEHNLDVIKNSDWIIDLGPEGGDKGGEIVAQGTPEQVAKIKKSYTGQYLKKVVGK